MQGKQWSYFIPIRAVSSGLNSEIYSVFGRLSEFCFYPPVFLYHFVTELLLLSSSVERF